MKRYNYEPGNATRYDLVYGRIEGTKQYVLVWLSKGGSGGTALQWEHFDDEPRLMAGYISEKMGIRRADAEAIAEFMKAHHPTRVKETS
tara:strand:+ start:587 stop:853 length:267 start_codon:yes stop_codon:yes gene_type:complete